MPLTLPTIVHFCLGDGLPGHPPVIEGGGQVWRQDFWSLITAGADVILERTARPTSRRLKVHLRSGVSRPTGRWWQGRPGVR